MMVFLLRLRTAVNPTEHPDGENPQPLSPSGACSQSMCSGICVSAASTDTELHLATSYDWDVFECFLIKL